MGVSLSSVGACSERPPRCQSISPCDSSCTSRSAGGFDWETEWPGHACPCGDLDAERGDALPSAERERLQREHLSRYFTHAVRAYSLVMGSDSPRLSTHVAAAAPVLHSLHL